MKDTAKELAILEDEFKSIKERIILASEEILIQNSVAENAINIILSSFNKNYRTWGCNCTIDVDSVLIGVPVATDSLAYVKLVFEDGILIDINHQNISGTLTQFPYIYRVYGLAYELGLEFSNNHFYINKIVDIVKKFNGIHNNLKTLQEEENEINKRFYALKRKQAATKDLIAQFDNGPFIFTEEALKLLLQTYSMPSLQDLGKHFQASGTRKQIIETIIDNLYV